MRIDGVIMEYVNIQRNIHAPLIARIKILSNLDIAERRLPQDGHFRVSLDDGQVNIRVSILPTVFGEKRRYANHGFQRQTGACGPFRYG